MFFRFSPQQKQEKCIAKKEAPKEEELYILSLGPFAPVPKLLFSNVPVGQTLKRSLYIKNPSPKSVLVKAYMTKDVNISLSWHQKEIEKQSEAVLDIEWFADCVDAFTQSLCIEADRRKLNVNLILQSISTSKKMSKPPTRNISPKKRYCPVKKYSPIQSKNKYDYNKSREMDTFNQFDSFNIENKENSFCQKTKNDRHLLRINQNGKDSNRRSTYTVNELVKPLTENNREETRRIPKIIVEEHKSDKSFSAVLNSLTFNSITPDTSIFSPNGCSTEEKSYIKPTISPKAKTLFPQSLNKNATYEVLENDQPIGSNISQNIGNISGGTYVRDLSNTSVENFDDSLEANDTRLTFSKFSNESLISHSSQMRQSFLSGDSVKDVLGANLWSHDKETSLFSIREETNIEFSPQPRFPLKRRSTSVINLTPPKKANISSNKRTLKKTLTNWSKKGCGRGMPLKHSLSKLNTSVSPKPEMAKENYMIKIQNPFLLAATNSIDPFITSSVYSNEEWVDSQVSYFTKWLNALLTPPAELDSKTNHAIDVAKVWQDCKNREIAAAPSKELLSNQIHVSRRLNTLRKSAQSLFQTESMALVLTKTLAAVESGKLLIREDRDIHLLLNLKAQLTSALLSYNPLWLRIGLETIFNELISLQSNSDIVGLTDFLMNRLFKDPYLLKKYKSIHSPKYKSELKKHFLKKYLTLVYFLDQAKNKKLIVHDPCLFSKQAIIKESKEMLTTLTREALSSIGDIMKYLKCFGYIVTHKQTYINEYDYAVTSLGGDLRDGVRLAKVMEIILIRDDLTAQLRVPAISRLQKIHNVKVVFNSLQEAGFEILYDITPTDIVEGHKEKTLSFLWQIIYKFEAPLMVKNCSKIQSWFRSLPIVIKRRKLQKIWMRRNNAAKKIQQWFRRQVLSEKLYFFAVMLKHHLETLKEEKAAFIIQNFLKTYICRKKYLKLHKTAMGLQRFARGWILRNHKKTKIKAVHIIEETYLAKLKMRKERTRYLNLKNAAIFVQIHFRSILLARKERQQFLTLKSNVIQIQQRFRANVLMKKERGNFLTIRKSVLIIQTWYRSIKRLRQDMEFYKKIKASAIFIQSRFLANKKMREDRTRFLKMKQAVVIFEQRYLALKLMTIERNQFILTKQAALIIATRYKARKLMKEAKESYQITKKFTIVVQRRFRAQCLMKKTRKDYVRLKYFVIKMQQRFRANKQMKIESQKFLSKKNSSQKIQLWFRAILAGRIVRKQYVAQKNAVKVIETRYLAKIQMKKEMAKYATCLKAVTLIQSKWRAFLAMRKERTSFCRLKNAVLSIEKYYEANLLCRKYRQQYVQLKHYTILVQARFRANKLMKIQRDEFVMKKSAVLKIEDWYSAHKKGREQLHYYKLLKSSVLYIETQYLARKLMKTVQQDYQTVKKASIEIQQRYRAWRDMKIQRMYYIELRAKTIFVQRKIRALILGRQERNQFIELKEATILIQSKFRAQKLMRQERKVFLEKRDIVVKLQERYRGLKQMREEYVAFHKLKKATIIIQRRFRANLERNKWRKQYMSLRNAALVVQNRFRAQQSMHKERQRYLQIKKSTIILQNWFRATASMKRERSNYINIRKAVIFTQRKYLAKRAMQLQRNSYLLLKSSAITIQRKFRANIEMRKQRQDYLTLLRCVLKLQNTFRANRAMWECRKRYLQINIATLKIQQYYRGYKLMKYEMNSLKLKLKAVYGLQRHIRGYLCRRQITPEAIEEFRLNAKRRKSAILIQRCWRGYIIRKKSKDHKRFSEIRQRLEHATISNKPQNTIRSKCHLALDLILDGNWTMATLTRALAELERLVQLIPLTADSTRRISEKLYILIVCSGRSFADMVATTHAVNILVHLYKHEESRIGVWSPTFLDDLLKIGLHWCDKDDPVFPSICTLLWLFCHVEEYRKHLLEIPQINNKLVKITEACDRKHKMILKMGKKNSRFSDFKNLPFPSKQPTWGIIYEKRPQVFYNSVHAWRSFLSVLNN